MERKLIVVFVPKTSAPVFLSSTFHNGREIIAGFFFFFFHVGDWLSDASTRHFGGYCMLATQKAATPPPSAKILFGFRVESLMCVDVRLLSMSGKGTFFFFLVAKKSLSQKMCEC